MTEKLLPTQVDSLQDIEETNHQFYKKNEEGKYDLDTSFIVNGYLAKTKALDSERKIRADKEKELKDVAKKYEGFDVEELKTLKQKQKDWEQHKTQKEQEGLEAKGQYEEALKKTKETHGKEIEGYKKQVSTLQQQIDEITKKYSSSEQDKKNYILNDKVKNAALKAGIFAEDVNDVLTLTKKHFNIDENNKVTIQDESGIPLNDMTLDKFFGEYFKGKKPKFYMGNNASGSGASTNKINSNFSSSNKEKTSIQKISAGLNKKN